MEAARGSKFNACPESIEGFEVQRFRRPEAAANTTPQGNLHVSRILETETILRRSSSVGLWFSYQGSFIIRRSKRRFNPPRALRIA
jgi:hypothetical protein